MDVHDSYDYVRIGLVVRLLRNATSEDRKRVITNSLKALRTCLAATKFKVSLSAVVNSARYGDMEKTVAALATDETPLTQEIAEEVRKQMTGIEAVVFAEAASKKVYVLPERRYTTEWLHSEPQKFLKDGDFAKLDEVAQRDIASAGRCILFGEATAAAFHILRATESVLKSYYYLHRKQKCLPNPMWANMLDQLRAKKKGGANKTLLSALDLIRASYRNPTQHPEALYTMEGAQDLFGVCLDAISKMATDLPSIA
jgi:hypothetical protein